MAGAPFTDPQGTYTITVGAEWKRQAGVIVAEVEAWSIGEPLDGFATNVNVVTQDAPGVGLRRYLDISIDGIKANKGHVLSQEITRGSAGQELGVLRYNSTAEQGLQYVAFVSIRGERAVLATLTARPAAYAAAASEVEPYLRTLTAT